MLLDNRNGQISMEYILITGFSLLIAIPLVLVFFQQSREFNDEITVQQANKVLDEMLVASKTVYYLGEPSQKTVNVYFPQFVNSAEFRDGYFALEIHSGSFTYKLYRNAPINFAGNISTTPGLHVLRIWAENNSVYIQPSTQ